MKLLLAGLIPIEAEMIDYMRVKVDGHEYLVHSLVVDRLRNNGAFDDRENEPKPVFVVGVAEEAHFWRDVRRVLFTGSQFTVLCRMSQNGVQRNWTAIKMSNVFESLDPKFGEPLRQLSSGDLLKNRDETSLEGSRISPLASATRILHEYLGSLCRHHSVEISSEEEGDFSVSIRELALDFETDTQKKQAFQTLASQFAEKYGRQLNTEAEAERRHEMRTLAIDNGLGEMTPAGVKQSEHATTDQRKHLLDTEFVAIYW